jgi:hypothetical protein
MADMIQVISQAFMAIRERPRNFIYSALWSFAISMVFLAVFMVFYFVLLFTSFGAAAAPAAGNLIGSFGVLLMFGIIMLAAVLSSPLQTVASMLYAKGSLEGRDIGLGDYISSVKEKYLRLLFAHIILGIFWVLALAAVLLVLGGIGYAIYLFAGKSLLPDTSSSYILLAVAALVGIVTLLAVYVGLSLLTLLYMPYVFSKQKLDRGLLGSLFYCISFARSRAWDILAYMLAMFVVYIAFMVMTMALSMIPCIGYVMTLVGMVAGFAISFAASYVLLYLVKDAP